MTMGEALKQARLKVGYTQKQLGIEAGCTQRHISNIEMNRKNPSDPLKKRIANVLKLDLKQYYSVFSGNNSVEFVEMKTPGIRQLSERISDKMIQDRLMSDCMRICSYNREDAEDLRQETTLQALLYQYRFNGKSQLHTWLYRIAKNIHLQGVRKYRAFTSLEDCIASPEEAEPEPELSARAFMFVNQLTEKKREMYRMATIGYTNKQIAAKLGNTHGYIKTRLHEIRKELQTLVN